MVFIIKDILGDNYRENEKYRYNKLASEIMKTGYFLNCNDLPCKLDECWDEGYDYSFESNKDHFPLYYGNCSLIHCAPIPITRKEAYERASYCRKYGYFKYYVKYKLSPRNSLGRNRVYKWMKEWNFFGQEPKCYR